MNAFHLTIVIIAVGIMVVACISGICSLMLSKRRDEHTDAPMIQQDSEAHRPFVRLWLALKRQTM